MAQLAVRLTPSASADRVDGWGVDVEGHPVLKVRVRARPVEGEANSALVKLMAKALGVPKSALAIQRGGQSRTRVLVIDTLSDADLRSHLTGL